jgi:Kinesin motor domain
MVRVVVRPHPDSTLLTVTENDAVVSIGHPRKGTTKPRTYQVSVALSSTTSQAQVFEVAVLPLLTKWLEYGQHGAIFAYGFTGTGKSFSLFGTEENPGSIVLAARYLLHQLKLLGEEKYPRMLRVSIYEVDGKEVKDLLTDEPLTVRVDEHGVVNVRRKNKSGPLTRVTLQTAEEFQSIWNKAQASRRVGSSTIHDASSRTHAVVDLEIMDDEVLRLEADMEEKHARYIQISNKKDDILKSKIAEAYKGGAGPDTVIDGMPLSEMIVQCGQPSEEALEDLRQARQALVDYKTSQILCFSGSFSMIDMAGNDWDQALTVQSKQAKKEHSDINSSLLAVKECFRAMQTRGNHIPYRRSSLTQILKRHFDPASNCTMLTTIYPKQEEDVTLKQTMNTLTYASSLVKI